MINYALCKFFLGSECTAEIGVKPRKLNYLSPLHLEEQHSQPSLRRTGILLLYEALLDVAHDVCDTLNAKFLKTCKNIPTM